MCEKKKLEFPPRFQLIDVSYPAGSFSTDLPLLLHSVCASPPPPPLHCSTGLPCSLAHRYMTYPSTHTSYTPPQCLLLLLNWQFLHVYKPKAKKIEEKRRNWSQAQLSPFPCLFVSPFFLFWLPLSQAARAEAFAFLAAAAGAASVCAACAHILLIVLFMMLLRAPCSYRAQPARQPLPKPNAVIVPIEPHRCHNCHLQVAAVPRSPTCCICI